MGEQEAALRGVQRRDVYLTGFGKFGNIVENPTTYVVQEIANDPNVTEALVLEVSAEGSLEMLQPLRAKAEERGRPCVFLHLGVAAGASAFRLEKFGYNLANFGIPDERGWVANNEIVAENEEDSLETSLPLDEILTTLLEQTNLAGISTDPGRYICNYVYFDSLRWVKKQRASQDGVEHVTLFLHVPEFNVIPFEDQVAFARKLIALLAEL